MMARNVLDGDMPLADWTQLDSGGALILDVREPAELNTGGDAIKGALNIPLSQLRGRLPEVPGDRDVWIICGAGQRAYFAQRLMLQNGYRARTLSGGYQTFAAMREAHLVK